MMVVNKTWLIAAIAAASLLLLLVVIVITALALKVKKKKLKQEDNLNQTAADDTYSSNIIQPDMAMLAEEIRANARLFDGLYEGIYNLAYNRDNNADVSIFKEWKDRVASLKEESRLREAFEKVFTNAEDDISRRARTLVECIDFAGIKRSEEAVHRVDGTTAAKYVCISGKPSEKGTVCTVVRPYWYVDESVVEQGIIIVKEG